MPGPGEQHLLFTAARERRSHFRWRGHQHLYRRHGPGSTSRAAPARISFTATASMTCSKAAAAITSSSRIPAAAWPASRSRTPMTIRRLTESIDANGDADTGDYPWLPIRATAAAPNGLLTIFSRASGWARADDRRRLPSMPNGRAERRPPDNGAHTRPIRFMM